MVPMPGLHGITTSPRHEYEGPEGQDVSGEPLVVYDRHNPESIRRAERMLQQRFGLETPPTLCSEPSGWMRRWGLAVQALLGVKRG